MFLHHEVNFTFVHKYKNGQIRGKGGKNNQTFIKRRRRKDKCPNSTSMLDYFLGPRTNTFKVHKMAGRTKEDDRIWKEGARDEERDAS